MTSQNRRNRALFGPEVYSKIELTDVLYCIVERIGRYLFSFNLIVNLCLNKHK